MSIGRIVTIDGPAGAGKSSIARQVAKALKFEFLDTGALYRAATLAVIRNQMDPKEVELWKDFVKDRRIEPDGDAVWLDGENVTDLIRTPEVTAGIVHLADVGDVRRQLNDIQRRYASGRSIVTEGRDQGTEVFPEAECKIFLTASPEERARRRQAQWRSHGVSYTLEEIRAAQDKRDAEDSSRPIGALRQAEDSVLLMTDGMTPASVLDRTLSIVRDQLKL